MNVSHSPPATSNSKVSMTPSAIIAAAIAPPTLAAIWVARERFPVARQISACNTRPPSSG